tara:strand:+ start:858 stop:1076 length:219 start_codon:yes stop_codon:yes gene_type:complete
MSEKNYERELLINEGPFERALNQGDAQVLTQTLVTQKIVDGFLAEETVTRTFKEGQDYDDTVSIKRIVKVGA